MLEELFAFDGGAFVGGGCRHGLGATVAAGEGAGLGHLPVDVHGRLIVVAGRVMERPVFLFSLIGVRCEIEIEGRAFRFGWGGGFGDPLGEFGFQCPVFRIGGEILPVLGIDGLVVELFGAVAIADIAPAIRADGVVALHEIDDGGRALGGGIFQERAEAEAFELLAFGKAAEVDESGIDVEEADGLIPRPAMLTGSGTGDDERDVGGALPESGLVPMLFFTEVPAVIGPENDDGVFGVAAFFEAVEEAADHSVGEGGGGEIGADGFTPLPFLDDSIVLFAAGGGELLADFGHVVEVAVGGIGDLDLIQRVHVEVLLRGVHRDVRMPEADSEKEGFLLGFCQEVQAEVDRALVSVFALFGGDDTPIELSLEIIEAVEGMALGGGDTFVPGIPIGAAIPGIVEDLELEGVPLIGGIVAGGVMEDNRIFDKGGRI